MGRKKIAVKGNDGVLTDEDVDSSRKMNTKDCKRKVQESNTDYPGCKKVKLEAKGRGNKKKEVVTVEDDSCDDGSSTFEIVCRPYQLRLLIGSLNPSQKEAVKEIGFGGLLELHCDDVNVNLAAWLLTQFNSYGYVLDMGEGENRKIQLDGDDVFDFVCLPRHKGNNVRETSRFRLKDAVASGIVQRWKSEFKPDNQDQIPLHLLYKYMTSDPKPSGDKFKRCFVVYAFGCFLAPSSNRTVDFRIVQAVEDVALIKTLDWCQYVLKRLGEAVSRWKEYRRNEKVGGCLLFLQVVYFHRSLFQGLSSPTTLPLIRHWDDSSSERRALLEGKGGYGGSLIEKSIYPICKRLGYQIGGQLQDFSIKEKLCKESTGPKSSFLKINATNPSDMRTIVFQLPKNGPSDQMIRDLVVDVVQAALMMCSRDMDVVLKTHISRIIDAKIELMKKNVPSSSGGNIDNAMIFTDNEFFEDPNLHYVIDEIVASVIAFKDSLVNELKMSKDCASTASEQPDNQNGEKVPPVENPVLGGITANQPPSNKSDCIGCSLDCGPLKSAVHFKVHESKLEENKKYATTL